MHHGLAIRPCRPDSPTILLPSPMAEWLAHPPARQHYDACAWVRIPVSPGKKFVKNDLNQVKFQLSTLRHNLYLQASTCTLIYKMHHGLAIRPCRPDTILLPSPMAEWLAHPPARQHYDACAWVRIPVSPGKNLSKMI